MRGVVIIGAGQAGVATATTLRREGYKGPITLVGEEHEAPYQRPPLSKDYLLGKCDDDALSLRSPRFYVDNAVSIRTGVEAVAIDRADEHVMLSDGVVLPYDHLVLATGSDAGRLQIPGHDLPGVMRLRTARDARQLRGRMETTRSVVIIGAGFVGLEFAAAMAGRDDVSVTVLERCDRVLARAVTPISSEYISIAHVNRGVSLLLDTAVKRFIGRDGTLAAVEDSNGTVHVADLALVGVGAMPRIALAETADLAVDNGIVVDEMLRTSDSHIFAIGDCARCRGVRLESVQNASDQGAHVAKTIAGTKSGPYCDLPWFWSDQKGLRLQIAGLIRGDESLRVIGDRGASRFSVLAFRDDSLVAVESVNRPGDHMAARRVLGTGRMIHERETTTRGFELKSLVPQCT
jgi:3-phenylpropionate/trans-cinnamate dioxygenase ferredoxin reductase subunit